MTNTKVKSAVELEWARANAAIAADDLYTAFAHLERAHILSQRLTLMHVRTHLAMLGVGWRRRDIREFGNWRYIMAAAPDNVLLELFEIDGDNMPERLAAYFSGP